MSLLCAIIAQGGKATSDFHWDDMDLSVLTRHGYLREAGIVSSVVCDDCDAPHSTPVVYENDDYGYFCPELGFVPLDSSRLVAYLPDVPLLVTRLAELFDCRQRKSSILHGQTWRIGAAPTTSEPVTLYFHPTLQTENDMRDLESALGREARSNWRLVVTSQGTVPMVGMVAARLDDLAEIDAETGNLRPIADPGILVGVPSKNPGGRPAKHGDLLKPLIDNRIRSGEAHEGVNAEAREVRAAFRSAYPHKPIPSESAAKRYIRVARRGS